MAVKGFGIEFGYDLEINDCGYNELNLQVFEPNSQLNSFPSNYILIVPSTQKLMKSFYGKPLSQKSRFADDHISYIEEVVRTISGRSNAKIIFTNFMEINDFVFGNYATKVDTSFIFQLRKINYELMLLSQKIPNLFINDLNSLVTTFGMNNAVDNKFYINSDISLSIDFLPRFAKNTLDIINSIEGRFKKCIILDLDNTLWGGIIGDDGTEGIQIGDLGIGKAFTEFQLWLKELKQRGIILAVCSKNTDSIAREPFETHPEMILKLDDISVFVANWETKVDNIRYIQAVLNIGFDSMVFIDDNPFERNLVAQNIPEITVPEMPEDPADYLAFLRELNLFETASFTEEDTLRTAQYQEEAKRTLFHKSFENEGEYLKQLDMKSKVEGFTKFNIPRVSQLTLRSNQYNLRTARYSEKEIEELSKSNENICLAFSLQDKFGEHGLICVVILKTIPGNTLFIDTWLMSCRVLKRGMQNFVLEQIIKRAKPLGITKLVGEYIPTPKNGIVENHYADLGFTKNEKYWELNVSGNLKTHSYINELE